MSTGVNTLAQFSYLLAKCQNAAFQDNRDKLDTVYTEYTKPGDTSEADYRSATVAGFGPAAFTTEVGAFYKDSIEAGQEITLTWNKFTIGFMHSEELLEDMMKNGRVKKNKIGLFKNAAENLAASCVWTKEQIATQFQTSAASATATSTWQGAGRDGLALASASHQTIKSPVVTISNSQTASSMTQLAIQEGITMLNNVKSEEGRPQAPVKKVILVYGRFHEWRVPEILQTAGQVDTANNNINTLKASKVQIVPVLNPYLSDTYTGWQLLDADNHRLLRFEAREPQYTMERDIQTGAYIHKVTMRYGVGFESYRGVVANAGV